MSGAGVEKAPARILPSKTLTSHERLEIYCGMYELRLLEALRVDYPGVVHFLGDETFDELARLYVRKHPSTSYTLNRLGDHLPAFVEEVDGLRQPRFVRALAELELAETIAFDGDSRALRLLELPYPAHRFLDAMRGGDPQPSMRPRRTWLAVYRRDYGVFHLELTKRAYPVMVALTRGVPLEAALGNAREDEIYEWFREWAAAGIVSADRS